MSDPYVELKAHFDSVESAEVNKGTGSQGIKCGKKMFAMFLKGDLLVQLPPARVAEVIAAGDGLPHDPGTGSPMKNRVLIPVSKRELWIAFCEESLRHVSGR